MATVIRAGAVAAAWGAITGTLASQSDLQTALTARVLKAGDTMTGTLLFSADNTLDLGASGTTRPRTGYFGTSVFVDNTSHATNIERFGLSWSSNIAFLQTTAGGSGTSARDMAIRAAGNNLYLQMAGGASGSSATLTNSSLTLISGTGPITITRPSVTASSGTGGGTEIYSTWNPSATSTLVSQGLLVKPTVNYSAGTPGAGWYEGVRVQAVETALPTGQSYLARLSAGSAGTTDIYRVTNKGHTVQAQVSSDLGTAVVSTTDMAIYRKNSKLVVAYNNAGTMNYLTIPLDGATATWTQSTLAP